MNVMWEMVSQKKYALGMKDEIVLAVDTICNKRGINYDMLKGYGTIDLLDILLKQWQSS